MYLHYSRIKYLYLLYYKFSLIQHCLDSLKLRVDIFLTAKVMVR